MEYKAGLKQWDRGKKLEITGLDVTENVQVHFSLTDSVGTAKCYDAIVDEGKICVDIPQFILEKEGTRGYSYYAYAWIYISTEELGETIREIVFNIDCRAKPEDYISDPEDIKTWEEHEKRISTLEKGGASDEAIASAVKKYLDENPIEAVSDEKIAEAVFDYLMENPIEGVTFEQIAQAVYEYMEENPIETGATKEQAEQIEKNKQDISKISEQIANIGGLVEPMEDDIPKVFIDGVIPTTKDDVLAEMTYISKTDKFHAYLKIKCQGTSSMSYDKKNFTIKMYSDIARETKLKKAFKDWGVEQNKYVLKANFIDHSHARNIVSARLWSEVVASRSDYDSLPTELKTSPNNGAIDGFPIKVYTNGTYQGIYTWNIGKDDWMWNMDEDNPNHVLLCAETNTDGVYSENPCNFRDLWSGIHEQNWSVEVGTNSDNVKNSLNALIACVKDTDDETFMATIGNHLDVQSAIDYYIQQYVTCGIDNLAKNMLLATYDGRKWICGSYDMDSTFGLTPQGGTGIVTYDYACPEQYKEQFSLLWERLVNCYSDSIKARYFSLRKTVYSLGNMVTKFERFMDIIGLDLFEEDVTIYGVPSATTNNIKYIRKFIRDRLVYTDQKMSELAGTIPCEGIILDRSELVFDSGEPIQLNAVVTPINTTENIVWESSDTTIARVSQGLVTPLNVGECTITVRCGDCKAECDVTVTVECLTLANQIKWEDGYYISGSTGEKMQSSNGDSVTDFINLNGAKHLLFGEITNDVEIITNERVQYYDINKNSLGKKSFYDLMRNDSDCSVLEGAVYARITIKTANKEFFDILSDVDLNGHLKLDASKFIESKEPSENGDINANNYGYYDDFIPVTNGQVVVFSNLADCFKDENERVFYDRKIVCYDESKAYIETIDEGLKSKFIGFFQVPEGVAYVKFVTHNTTKDYRYYKILG